MSGGFGKLFAGLYEGSMLGAGVHVFALWPYCISRADANGYVEVNPRLAAVVLGCSIPEVEAALDYLQRPDPESRTKEQEGRRLVRDGQFLYRIVNYAKYREARDAEARREYQREWDKTHRPSGAARSCTSSPTQSDTVRHSPTVPDTVRQSPTSPTKAEAEAEAEAEARERGADAPVRPPRRKFVAPTLDEVRAYLSEIHATFSADQFLDYNEERGWRWGKPPGYPVKDWKRVARAWKARDQVSTVAHTVKPQYQGVLIGAHQPGEPELREVDDHAPEEIRAIAGRLRRREATDSEVEMLDAWQHGDEAYGAWLRQGAA